MDDKYLYAERAAVMLTIVIFSVFAGLVGFGLGYWIAALLR